MERKSLDADLEFSFFVSFLNLLDGCRLRSYFRSGLLYLFLFRFFFLNLLSNFLSFFDDWLFFRLLFGFDLLGDLGNWLDNLLRSRLFRFFVRVTGDLGNRLLHSSLNWLNWLFRLL